MKYCNYCHRMIKPEKKVNYFILLLLTFFTGGSWLLFYAIYYFFFKRQIIQKNPTLFVDMPMLHDKAIIRLDTDEVAKL